MKSFFDTTGDAGGKIPSTGPKTLSAKKGTRHVIRGTVINCKGQPIKNAKIDQIHILGGGSLKKTGLRTRGGGQFTLITPDNLTTRQIKFNYRPFLDSSTVSASSSVTLHIR